MKKMLVALAIALVPVTVSPAFAATVRPSKASVVAAWPTICFEFAFWKYCI
jgi:hypothetical protein